MIVNRMPNIFYRPHDDGVAPEPPPINDHFEFLSGEDWLLLDNENFDLLE